MCKARQTPPAFECTVGDLQPGSLFHGPDGENFVVLDLPARMWRNDFNDTNDKMVVDTRYGRITPVHAAWRLGRDHNSILYASRALNDWYCD